jgi:hypothetical protein
MALQSSPLKIIDLYIEQELLMASLYERFAKCYTAQEKYWVSLVSEEHEHAAWIKHFLSGAAQGKVHFDERNSRIAAIDSVITYIKTLIDEFDNQPFENKKAANISLDLEKSLIERNIFKHFESDSSEVKKFLDVLCKEQETHLDKIKHFTASLNK